MSSTVPGWSVPVQVVESPGGIRAWLIEDSSVPVFALNFAFLDAGAAADPGAQEGLAGLAAALLTQGAGALSATGFQDRLRDTATSLSFVAGRETVSGSLRALSANAAEAAGLLAMALGAPRFDATELGRVRAGRLASLRQDATAPRATSSRLWWEKAFPATAFGRQPVGTEAGLAAITRDDLQAFMAARLSRARLVVAAAGALDAATLGRLLDQAFGPLAAPAPPAIAVPTRPDAFPLALARLAAPQSAVAFGQPALALDDADWDAQLVVNRILAGGGFSSRLMDEVREKRGLAYGIGAQIVPFGAKHALILGATATENARLSETLSVLREVWAAYAAEGPTGEELDDAKAYLAGSFPLSFTSTPDIARSLVSLQLAGRPPDWLEGRLARLEAVDLSRARAVARRLYDPAALSIAVAGDPQGI
jgi:zinc protease